MFNPDAFIASLDDVRQLLIRLGQICEWKFGTIGLPVAMNGRDIPKDFKGNITSALQRSNPSSHQRLVFQRILTQDLPQAAKLLRQQYATASGGLCARTWRAAHIDFVLANGGSAGLTWKIPDLRPLTQATQELPLGASQAKEFAVRLQQHARLNLRDSQKSFELAERKNSTLTFVVRAPNPGLALARLSVLNAKKPETWPHIREIHDAETALRDAHKHLK